MKYLLLAAIALFSGCGASATWDRCFFGCVSTEVALAQGTKEHLRFENMPAIRAFRVEVAPEGIVRASAPELRCEDEECNSRHGLVLIEGITSGEATVLVFDGEDQLADASVRVARPDNIQVNHSIQPLVLAIDNQTDVVITAFDAEGNELLVGEGAERVVEDSGVAAFQGLFGFFDRAPGWGGGLISFTRLAGRTPGQTKLRAEIPAANFSAEVSVTVR